MNRSTIFPFLSIFIFAVGCTAQVNEAKKGKTDNSSREMNIDKKFTGISTSNSIEIIYTQNDLQSKAVISGKKEIVDNLTYNVNSDGTLSFKLPRTYEKKSYHKIIIQLNGGSINSFQASSSGIINVKTPIVTTKEINVSASSGGQIIFNEDVTAQGSNINVSTSSSGITDFLSKVRCSNIYLSSSSNGNIKISGSSIKMTESSNNSSGDIEESALLTGQTYVSISSKASVSIKRIEGTVIHISASSAASFKCKNIFTRSMDMVASSGADIKVGGICENASMNSSSGGDINAKDLIIEKTPDISTSSGGKVLTAQPKKN